MSTRKRGAQPGNLNALKHGFYARFFRPAEASDLEAILETGLSDEIALLRVAMRRLFERAAETDEPRDYARLFAALAAAAGRLASLVQVQARLGKDSGADVIAAINQALSEVRDEMKLKL